MLLIQKIFENQNAEKSRSPSPSEDSAEPGLRTQSRRVSSGFRHKAELAQADAPNGRDNPSVSEDLGYPELEGDFKLINFCPWGKD